MEQEKNDVTGILKDPRQASILAVVTLAGGLLGGGSFSFISQQDLFTLEDWRREYAALEMHAEASHTRLEAKIKTDTGAMIKDQLQEIKNAISTSRDRMDKLVDSNSKISALIEQYVLYQRAEHQRIYRDPTVRTP